MQTYRIALTLAAIATQASLPAAAQTAVASDWPEMAPDVMLPQILSSLKRTLKAPRSIRDFVFCPPAKVKMKDVKPVRWSILFSLNAKNSFGGYAGVQMYGAIFKNGRLSNVVSTQIENNTGLDGLINNMVAAKMVSCPAIPDEKIQQLLSSGTVALP